MFQKMLQGGGDVNSADITNIEGNSIVVSGQKQRIEIELPTIPKEVKLIAFWLEDTQYVFTNLVSSLNNDKYLVCDKMSITVNYTIQENKIVTSEFHWSPIAKYYKGIVAYTK